jgi:pimeloyl-ACP methyl ester carboxylesterase
VGIALRDIEANGMTFRSRVVEGDGEPVILLHGFPETSVMWTPLLERLEERGYRALAPDQRGYSPGARPDRVDEYGYVQLASDVVALADTMGYGRFHLVGHDWGAGAGWSALSLYPERIQTWTALSVPHLAAFGRAIREDEDQQRRSQYINLFVREGAAEAALADNDFAGLKGVWSAHPQAEVDEYLEVFRQPGALTAALNWYRASRGIDPSDEQVEFGAVETPTVLIWGNQDAAIGRRAVDDAEAFMIGPYTLVELDAGHWLIQEEPERVVAETINHIEAYPIA